ncbi:MAG: DUF445 family protein [candidate division WOR-3 bacterium]
MPFISAFIGWLTNVIAIWLLFHPRKKILGIQGVVPKYKEDIAKRIGIGIKEYLLDEKTLNSFLKQYISYEKLSSIILKKTKSRIQKFLLEKILLPLLKEKIEEYIHILIKEVPNSIKIDKLVEEKIKSYDLIEVEKIFYHTSNPEIRFIKLSGAILGFIIGLIQIVIIKLSR